MRAMRKILLRVETIRSVRRYPHFVQKQDPGRSGSIVSQSSERARCRETMAWNYQRKNGLQSGYTKQAPIMLLSRPTLRYFSMTMLPLSCDLLKGGGNLNLVRRWMGFWALAFLLCVTRASAQDDQLNKVHVQPPAASSAPTTEPKGAEAAPETGVKALKVHPGSFIRMDVDMVLVPVTITDPMNRLVTGLEKSDFQVYENNGEQTISSFAAEDAPVSIGIIFDLSGSMTSKLIRAKDAILQF